MKKNIRWLHADMDSYFASCEQQANPLLRGEPVGVCGNPQGGLSQDGSISRTVIAAASKEAKECGVQSGMPPFRARKLCSEIRLVAADGPKYRDIRSRFLNIFRHFSPRVEPFSIDEAFLKVDFLKNRKKSPEAFASRLQKQIKNKLGAWISCSCGLGPNKFLAKVASDFKKPEGVFRLDQNNKDEVFQKLNLSDVFGIGAKTAKELRELGVESLARLKEVSLFKLQQEFGQRALTLKKIARGEPLASLERPCSDFKNTKFTKRDAYKSRSRSQTLAQNHANLKALKPKLLQLSKDLAQELRKSESVAETVKLNLVFGNLGKFSKQKKAGKPLQDEVKIFSQTLALLTQAPKRGSVRKVGIELKRLKPQSQPFLFKRDRQRREFLKVQDEIEAEFGEGTLFPLRVL